MEKLKSEQAIANSLRKLDLNRNPNPRPKSTKSLSGVSLRATVRKSKPPTLVKLCVGVVGKHLEEIIPDLGEIAATLPTDIKVAVAAIARRRKLLEDNIIISLVDSSWEVLDVSGSDVSDSGLAGVAKICRNLRAVDISRCIKITSGGVSELLHHCHSLETLRCGGCPRSNHTARRCLSMFKPNLNDAGEDSWEELETKEIIHGTQSLRWLVWPHADKDSLETLSTECPRIVVNPKPSPYHLRGAEVPREALEDITLDDQFVEDIDPETWSVSGSIPKTMSPSTSGPNELSVAEKFRLAFVERDARLEPKRAKNARQKQRRAEREWVMASTRAKAIALAFQASKVLYKN